jgi:acyl carrier protein
MDRRAAVERSVAATLVRVTGRTEAECVDARLHLVHDLFLDSLALLELVVNLESDLGITVPDEETGQFHTVGDLQAAAVRLSRTP